MTAFETQVPEKAERILSENIFHLPMFAVVIAQLEAMLKPLETKETTSQQQQQQQQQCIDIKRV